MHTVQIDLGISEMNDSAAFEAAAVFASAGPWGVVTMGTFPSSLVAFGWMRRQNSDNTRASRVKSEGSSTHLKHQVGQASAHRSGCQGFSAADFQQAKP